MVNCWIYRKKKKRSPSPRAPAVRPPQKGRGEILAVPPFFQAPGKRRSFLFPLCSARGAQRLPGVLLRSRGAARFQPMARFSVRCFGYCSRSSPVFYTEPRKAGFVRLSSSGSECFSSPDRPSQGRGSEPRRSRCWWRQGCCACRTDAEDSCHSAHAAWP